MSTLRTLVRLVLVAALLAAPVVVARAWQRSRTQVHSISHGRG
jgi:ABC-type Mn2+/Zn2+ transport system permease subunit